MSECMLKTLHVGLSVSALLSSVLVSQPALELLKYLATHLRIYSDYLCTITWLKHRSCRKGVLRPEIGIQYTCTYVQNSEHHGFELDTHKLLLSQEFSYNRYEYTYVIDFLFGE